MIISEIGRLIIAISLLARIVDESVYASPLRLNPLNPPSSVEIPGADDVYYRSISSASPPIERRREEILSADIPDGYERAERWIQSLLNERAGTVVLDKLILSIELDGAIVRVCLLGHPPD